jgi:hypothetical protein
MSYEVEGRNAFFTMLPMADSTAVNKDTPVVKTHRVRSISIQYVLTTFALLIMVSTTIDQWLRNVIPSDQRRPVAKAMVLAGMCVLLRLVLV